MTTAIPNHPLDHQGVIKLILSQHASDLLAAHGDQFVGVISHPDATAPPEAAGRLILTALPCDRDRLHDSCLVALGKARAVKPRLVKP